SQSSHIVANRCVRSACLRYREQSIGPLEINLGGHGHALMLALSGAADMFTIQSQIELDHWTIGLNLHANAILVDRACLDRELLVLGWTSRAGNRISILLENHVRRVLLGLAVWTCNVETTRPFPTHIGKQRASTQNQG